MYTYCEMNENIEYRKHHFGIIIQIFLVKHLETCIYIFYDIKYINEFANVTIEPPCV